MVLNKLNTYFIFAAILDGRRSASLQGLEKELEKVLEKVLEKEKGLEKRYA